MATMTRNQKDAELARQFLEQIGWAGEFHPLVGFDQRALDRFWSKFRFAGGHWLWTRSTTPTGSGQFALTPHRTLKTHRVAWMLTRGEIAEDMVLTRRDCEHPECGNPEHYREITKTEAHALGGRTGGRGNVKSRPQGIPMNCSQDLIDVLRALHAKGHTLFELHNLARGVGLGPAAIQHIIKGNARGVR